MSRASGVTRAAAIDFGTVRIGLAVADELGLLAHPRPCLEGRNPGAAVERLRTLAEAEGLGLFIVGLPRNLDGTEGPSARRARRFAERLARRSGLPVELLDEWWSSKEAAARLRCGGLDQRAARGRLDSAAAAILLQTWLDRRRDGPE